MAGIAEVEGEAEQGSASVGQAFEGVPETEPIAVAVERHAGLTVEDAAEVEGG